MRCYKTGGDSTQNDVGKRWGRGHDSLLGIQRLHEGPLAHRFNVTSTRTFPSAGGVRRSSMVDRMLLVPRCWSLARARTTQAVAASGERNVTVKHVPQPLSPGKIRNPPSICRTNDCTIFIPSPLLWARSNPAGNPGPSSNTDNTWLPGTAVSNRATILPLAYFAALV